METLELTLYGSGSHWEKSITWWLLSGGFVALSLVITTSLFFNYTGLVLIALLVVKLVGLSFLWVLFSQLRAELLSFKAIMERQAQEYRKGSEHLDKVPDCLPKVSPDILPVEALVGSFFLLLSSSLVWLNSGFDRGDAVLMPATELLLLGFSWRVAVLAYRRMERLSSVSRAVRDCTKAPE